MKLKSRIILASLCLFCCGEASVAQSLKQKTDYDISKDKVLYTIGYSHLDTQWNWDYPRTIDEYIKNIMTENFYLFDKYPNYVFNFTGSYRYHMMKEYYPELYKKVKQYIKEGRWRVSGSSVDEAETIISDPESIIRQVLYGNDYFKTEFGKESEDYILPDCFGFPACLPTILNYAGIKGFSTQKLTWGSAVGVPFNVGVWVGSDGNGLISALNAGTYVGHVKPNLDLDEEWNKRLDKDKSKTGYAFDYMYYGVGDMGGAPRENDVKHAEESLYDSNSKFKVLLTSSDQMYKDITPEIKKSLPEYKGDLLLTEHSAGSATSQAFMKKMNRKNELLAKATEQLAVFADCEGFSYPCNKLNNAWELLLESQFHDILPGTSIPKAYEYAWNNEFISANMFSDVLQHSVDVLSRDLNTMVKGTPVVVYNPVAIDRNDIITAQLSFDKIPENLVVVDCDGKVVPSQILEKKENVVKFIFQGKVPSVGLAVFDVRESSQKENVNSSLKVTDRSLENEYYIVEVDDKGNIASIYDKKNKCQLLSKPATLDFQSEKSYVYPAWNMLWSDRQKPPFAYMDEDASMHVVENGPLRVALEVQRKGQNSTITQVFSLSAGISGKQLVVDNTIDWQSTGVSLKAAFPLTAKNDETTYNEGVGTIERGINNEKKFEVPSRKWFDQTDKSGKFGVSILEDCKFGSDKPDANTIRLTLLFTPEVKNNFVVQKSQDWGIHEFKYGIYAHAGDWKKALTPWQGQSFNQPMLAFSADKHQGNSGKYISLVKISSSQVGLMALKKMEHSDYYVIRVNELLGKNAQNIHVKFPMNIVDAYEVNGQEEKIGKASFSGENLNFSVPYYAIKSYAIKFAKKPENAVSKQNFVELPYDIDAFSYDANRDDGNMDGRLSIPAELISDTLFNNDIAFKIGSKVDEEKNALTCKGQEIQLPEGRYNSIYILAAATKETVGNFVVGGKEVALPVQYWSGYIGQHYNREFEQDDVTVKSIKSPYVKKDNIAWFSSHRHYAYPSKNKTYEYSYIFKYRIDLPENVNSIKLPENKFIRIFAITAVKEDFSQTKSLQPLYDDFSDAKKVELR